MPTKVSINLVVHNAEKFIRSTLDSILAQTYKDFEINILDNKSTDSTVNIVKEDYPMCRLIQNNENIGFWAGQEKLFPYSNGEYIVAATDVILDKNFLAKAVEILEADDLIGAVQAKIYQMNFYNRPKPEFTNIIDTVGFKLFRSRRLVNKGQGESDEGQYNQVKEIFGVEGAIPVFRKKALEDCKIDNHFIDPDFRIGPLGYGDDFDLAWRMHLFGWKQMFSPDIIAYHDRSTAREISEKWFDYLKRVSSRKQIDIKKRRLEWRNLRFTGLKNDYIINILKDLPFIVLREIEVLSYAVLFEQKVLFEIPALIKFMPKMLRKRKRIMAKAKIKAQEIRKWMNK